MSWLLQAHPVEAHDPAVVAAARKEGRVAWLTTQIMGELALPLAAAFKSEHGVDVHVVRTTSRQTADRLTQAARSPQSGIDVVDGRSAIPHLKRAGLLVPLASETLGRVQADLADRDGYWIATNVYFNTVAINIELVEPARRPRTILDLLRPDWRGRIAWSGQATLSAGAGFVGAVLKDQGEAAGRSFLARLAEQQIASFDVSSRQVIDKVIAGQFEMALQVFNTQAAISAGRGAPVAWLPLEPLTASVTAVGITRQAPHPNAARLLVEFLLSRKGQEIFREADYLPASSDVAPKDPGLADLRARHRTVLFAPEEIEAQMQGWQALRNELFR